MSKKHTLPKLPEILCALSAAERDRFSEYVRLSYHKMPPKALIWLDGMLTHIGASGGFSMGDAEKSKFGSSARLNNLSTSILKVLNSFLLAEQIDLEALPQQASSLRTFLELNCSKNYESLETKVENALQLQKNYDHWFPFHALSIMELKLSKKTLIPELDITFKRSLDYLEAGYTENKLRLLTEWINRVNLQIVPDSAFAQYMLPPAEIERLKHHPSPATRVHAHLLTCLSNADQANSSFEQAYALLDQYATNWSAVYRQAILLCLFNVGIRQANTGHAEAVHILIKLISWLEKRGEHLHPKVVNPGLIRSLIQILLYQAQIDAAERFLTSYLPFLSDPKRQEEVRQLCTLLIRFEQGKWDEVLRSADGLLSHEVPVRLIHIRLLIKASYQTGDIDALHLHIQKFTRYINRSKQHKTRRNLSTAAWQKMVNFRKAILKLLEWELMDQKQKLAFRQMIKKDLTFSDQHWFHSILNIQEDPEGPPA